MNAQPAPMVSGSHFFPAAALLCTKLMPACLLISRNVTCADPVETSAVDTRMKKNDRCMTLMELVICPPSSPLASLPPLPTASLDQAGPTRARESAGVRYCPRDAAGGTVL